MLWKTKKLNITCRNCMKTNQDLQKYINNTIIKYKETMFATDSPICIKCLDEFRKQQLIDEKVYDQKLMNGGVRKLS